MRAKSLELKHTIKHIKELDSELNEIENEIKIIMDELNSPILSIPGISYKMGGNDYCNLSKGDHFIIPYGYGEYELTGDMMLITSWANEG